MSISAKPRIDVQRWRQYEDKAILVVSGRSVWQGVRTLDGTVPNLYLEQAYEWHQFEGEQQAEHWLKA